MNEVKRYAMPIALGGRLVVPQEAEKGLWCMYQDYAKLESENTQLRTERDRLKGLLLGIRDGAKWDANSDHGLVARIDDELAALTQREGGQG